MKILVTGGSKCGKSTFAENLAQRLANGSPVTYIATMQVVDAEDLAVVARHKKQREGRNYQVIEQQKNLSALTLEKGATVLLEDIPNLLANEMFLDGCPDKVEESLMALSETARYIVFVTNEVGSDGFPYDEDTLRYLSRISQVNRAVAQHCEHVVEVVCGIPLYIKGVPV